MCVNAQVHVRATGRTLSIGPLVSLGNTCRAFVERAYEVAGRVGYISKPNSTSNGNLPFYQWRVKNITEVGRILRTVEPYLIIKRERVCDLLLVLSKYDDLIAEPLLDPKASARYQKVPRDQVTRRRLANRGQQRFAMLLLPWLEKHQADSRTLAHVLSFVEVTNSRTRD